MELLGAVVYNLNGLNSSKLKSVPTPYGNPSDKILISKYKNLEIMFLPRHGVPIKFHLIK